MYFLILQMGDRVGPVGTGEASSSLTSGGSERPSVNWSTRMDRQEVLVSRCCIFSVTISDQMWPAWQSPCSVPL